MRKNIVFILALTLALQLVACEGQQAQSGGGESSNIAPSTSTTSVSNGEDIIATLEEIIEPEKELTTFEKLFADGPILAQDEDELWGYIDNTGAWVFEPQLSKGYNEFIDGLALVQNPETELWGFIGTNGHWAVEAKYKRLYEFSEGLANAQDAETEKWGFIDKRGDWIVEPKYNDASAFHSGLASVLPFKEDLKDDETYGRGYIDQSGKLVIPYQFDEAWTFEGDRALVRVKGDNDSYSVIDKAGNNLGTLPYGYIPFKADKVSFRNGVYAEWYYDWMILANQAFAEKVTASWMRGGDWSSGYAWDSVDMSYFNSLVIDKNLNVVFDGYEHNCNVFLILNNRGDLYVIDKTTGRKGIASMNGEWIVKPECNSLIVFSDEVRYSTDDDALETGGYISHTLKIEGIGGENPPAKPFTTEKESESLLYEKITKIEGVEKHGFVDKDGNTVVECIYDAVGRIDPNDGTCFGAQIDGLWGIADRNGSWLIQPQFLEISGLATWDHAFPQAQ